ncbi:hypothetical protein PMZ80_008114 [Knufia obscura]|uniref:Uncharacterized protein n=1 Tax=Knufia obscura TaxID=1635080 RepID=A0ABR0RGJ1_9EURO|nr:hypothetical protein PMZ80_008114 [Knufia obscura]
MPTPKLSPALKPARARAPEPSAALLALQERGLELPRNRQPSISPQSDPAFDGSLRVSPLSIVSTPSNMEKPLPSEPGESWRRRPSSTGSAEITNILNLYTNLSEHSLKSEYEEMTPYPDDSDDEDESPLTAVYQPKAYRDTIAPLLEHQFSTERLTVPAMPSPMSIASLPRLHHPNARDSVPSLQLTPDVSPNLQPTTSNLAGLSQTSIQITPDMTPPLAPIDPGQAPSFQEYSANLRERQIALEVPDVREADSWYDQPLSPVSPEEPEDRLRDSQLSAISPFGENYQRQLTYESLAPPAPQKSPNMRPVSYVEDYLPGPISATLTHVVDNQMVPPPLDLSRSPSKAVSKISEGSAPVHQLEIRNDYPSQEPKSQHASLMVDDPIEGPMRTYLTPPPPERFSDMSTTAPKEQLNIEEIYRPGSAFSDSSDPPSPDTMRGQLKAVFKFGKKKDKGSKDSRDSSSKKKKSKSGPVPPKLSSSLGFQDDLDSYKFPYWKSHQSAPAHDTTATATTSIAPPHRLQSPDLNSLHSSQTHVQEMRRLSAVSGPGPSVSSSPQPQYQPHTPEPQVDPSAIGLASPRPPIKRREPQPAIPLTNYQKYGVEIWNEKDKKKRAKEAEKAAKQAEKAAMKQAKAGHGHGHGVSGSVGTPDAQLNAFLDSQNHGQNQGHDYFSRPVMAGTEPGGDQIDARSPDPRHTTNQRHSRPESSRAYSHMKTTSDETTVSASRPSSDAASISSRNSGTGGYNNALFEASGGAKKKGKFASRLMMSSEEKRKMKVKESITIVGRMKIEPSGVGSGSRTSEVGTKGLVRI